MRFSNFWTIKFGTFFGFSFHTFSWLAETPQKGCLILQQFTHSLTPESTLRGQLCKIKAIPPTVNYVKCFLYNQKTDVYTLSLSQIRFKLFSRLRRFLVDLPLIVYEKKKVTKVHGAVIPRYCSRGSTAWVALLTFHLHQVTYIVNVKWNHIHS